MHCTSSNHDKRGAHAQLRGVEAAARPRGAKPARPLRDVASNLAELELSDNASTALAHRSRSASEARQHADEVGEWLATNRWLTIALWPVRPLGRQGGEADRGSKGAKGEVGHANGSPFSPDAPGLGCCNDFKDASKAALLPPTYWPSCPRWLCYGTTGNQ
jgi:hypothetical protein